MVWQVPLLIIYIIEISRFIFSLIELYQLQKIKASLALLHKFLKMILNPNMVQICPTKTYPLFSCFLFQNQTLLVLIINLASMMSLPNKCQFFHFLLFLFMNHHFIYWIIINLILIFKVIILVFRISKWKRNSFLNNFI